MTISTFLLDGFGPLPLVRPGSMQEIGELIRSAATKDEAIYPLGGLSHLSLGNPPSKQGVAVDLRGLAQIIDFPARDMTITVQAGITMYSLRETLSKENLRLPIDVADADRVTLGGILAANISGPLRYGYGTLRDYVIGISALNDEGREFKAGGRVVKNVAGYDLCKLLIGSLGTLGIITQATLKLRPRADVQAIIAIGCESAQLEELLTCLHGSRTRPVCIELLNQPAAQIVFPQANLNIPEAAWCVLVGYEGNSDAVYWQVQQLVREMCGQYRLHALVDFTAAPLFHALVEFGAWPERQLTLKANLLPSAVAGFCQGVDGEPNRPALRAHAGNGIVQGRWPAGLTMEQAARNLAWWRDLAAKGSGSVIVLSCPSNWKTTLNVWGPTANDAWLMREVKAKFDPKRIFNPGRFVDGIEICRLLSRKRRRNRMTISSAESTRMALPTVAAKHDAGIDYELFLDCVHCGLCTSACPTYVELGDENDSPRGRIYLMRAVTDGRIELDDSVQRHLDLCLDCRACESACPSGVQYGKLIEPFRMHMQKTGVKKETLSWLERLLLYRLTPYAGRMRLALAPARLAQWTGLDRMLRKLGVHNLLPASLRELHAMLPPLKPHYGSMPEVLPAEGPRRARVALFTGCAADAFFPETNVATARVLQKNGCEVWIPRRQVCCGALHYHAGLDEPARQFAKANCDTFLPSPSGSEGTSATDIDAIIVNAAGCGAMLKDYGHLFQRSPLEERVAAFAGKVKDISEFLVELGPIMPTHPLNLKATYHDACHLCHGQQIRKQPRQLLELIPELQLVPLNESEICCGAAGSYNLTQPEMARRLGERKAKNVLETEADAVFSGNVGCLLQLGRYLRSRKPGLVIAHPVDALWASYCGKLIK